MDIKVLRKKYPKFVYKSYSYEISGNDLKIFFDFQIVPNISFRPKILIKNIEKKRIGKLKKGALDNFIFNLGLMEIPSYWKATCSPLIEIRAGCLDRTQIIWWKKLLIDGMGQFYYENKIDWRDKNFLKIVSLGQKFSVYKNKLGAGYLVPFAGGRDSIVTLEALKKKLERGKITLFTLNPIEKIQKTVKVTGIKKQIIARRVIDKKLLALNRSRFPNGHTPFTALLSFISVLCAVIFDYRNIVFSNEKSSDEGNVKYLGKMINHQWAKSSQFEKMFSQYSKKFLAKDINYFSYLRKYGELKISKMLTNYQKYFSVFSSCNASMKIGARQTRWCGNCPKCLFVYMSFYSYLEKKDLLKIFGKDVFENKKLLPAMKSLIGQGKPKPFECVGTKAESRRAFELCLKKAKKEGEIPFLLAKTG